MSFHLTLLNPLFNPLRKYLIICSSNLPIFSIKVLNLLQLLLYYLAAFDANNSYRFEVFLLLQCLISFWANLSQLSITTRISSSETWEVHHPQGLFHLMPSLLMLSILSESTLLEWIYGVDHLLSCRNPPPTITGILIVVLHV